ncbi:MAG: hypothetical protein ACKVP4_12085 [Hyphomicrobium sp.]
MQTNDLLAPISQTLGQLDDARDDVGKKGHRLGGPLNTSACSDVAKSSDLVQLLELVAGQRSTKSAVSNGAMIAARLDQQTFASRQNKRTLSACTKYESRCDPCGEENAYQSASRCDIQARSI